MCDCVWCVVCVCGVWCVAVCVTAGMNECVVYKCVVYECECVVCECVVYECVGVSVCV